MLVKQENGGIHCLSMHIRTRMVDYCHHRLCLKFTLQKVRITISTWYVPSLP